MYIRALPGLPSLPRLADRLADRPGLAWLCGGPAHGDAGRWSFLASDPAAVVACPWDAQRPWETLSLQLGEPAQRPMEPAGPGMGRSAPAGAPPPRRVPRWIGYLAYEGIGPHGYPTGPRAALAAPSPCPSLRFARYPALLAIDHQRGRAFVVGDDAQACAAWLAKLERAAARPRAELGAPRATPQAPHRQAIETARERIAQGHIYQVNLARRWIAAHRGHALALWQRMRRLSPVPLGLFLDAGDHAVLACTMERFLRWDAATRALWTRPIKGTIARRGGADTAEAARLRADPKERAEHAMIVDLMRNDLGRVGEPGSVQVEGFLQVEPYARLSHLVSTVRCQTRADVGLDAILAATFPPGSVTGTPKASAIRTIRELEACPRGIYTGAVGHVDWTGGLSLAVAIRTAVVGSGHVQYHAGGGIVWDSDPAREVAETELKAQVFVQAARELAGRRVCIPTWP